MLDKDRMSKNVPSTDVTHTFKLDSYLKIIKHYLTNLTERERERERPEQKQPFEGKRVLLAL